MRLKKMSQRMILLAFLLAFFVCLCTACTAKKEKKENPSGVYQLYSMESGGDSYSNEDIVSYGLDSMTLTLYEDGTGSMGFADDVDEFTWADGVMTSGGDSLPFTLEDGMLTISDDTDTMVFTRVGDAPKKAEVTGGLQEDVSEDTASATDEMTETIAE